MTRRKKDPLPEPTGEQAGIIQAFSDGGNLVIEAGAGTGKTTTLRHLAESSERSGVYLAYNATVRKDAQKVFPKSVACHTNHSLAYAYMIQTEVGNKVRAAYTQPRMPGYEKARILGIRDPVRVSARLLAPAQVASIASETVTYFSRSAYREVNRRNVPRLEWATPAEQRELEQVIVPIARKAWADIIRPDGRLPFNPEHYLKMWQLTGPRIDADYILLDEAQDSNRVILDVVLRQDAQLVAVGDRSQQLYAWRGAHDAMDSFPGAVTLPLSESFRFGQPIADEANKWLSILGASLQLKGHGEIQSAVTALEFPEAVLCRTNAECIRQAMAELKRDGRPAIVGGAAEVKSLAIAAQSLMAGRPVADIRLAGFQNWAEVRDHAEHDHDGSDMLAQVKIIDQHGPDEVLKVIGRLASEQGSPTVIISTGHKAKGREWGTVKIAPDFREPKRDKNGDRQDIPREQSMLAYVSVTRARHVLDNDSIRWAEDYVPVFL